ncbi:hypothetical protein [Luteimonas sp. MC1750]|uniref:hypothetical protein n=1 Tax=Luteimonas sp. MC1750 TaxID=2799326 RepID=UPI0018F0E7D2|nr:hypothetical protein [Luteimonas sp. MC1750]MBJ6983464.1 hypothetical protein [Luteimonas sp. MC1750]QQO06316.1 hypothetical protein JGR68_02385 [Luteimonas sp. MC1750]
MLTDTDAAPPAPRGRPWAQILLPAMVFAMVFGIACLHYQGQTLARGPDQADMLLAFFNEASHAIEEEGLLAAMYTEGVRAGESNWSNPNYHMLYPLYLNWAGADASPAATLDRLNLVIVLHLALLGAGAYALARALGVRVVPAVLVGLAIPWFPAVRSAAGWPHIIAGMAWIPWVLAAQVALYRGSGWRLQVPRAIGLVMAATLLAHAHPAQNMVFAAWASAAVWLLVCAQVLAARDRDGLRRLARSSGWLALSALLVLALCWPWLREILAFHGRSIRWLGEVGGFVVGDQPVPVHALRYHALAPADAGQLVAFRVQPGIGNAYLGAAVLVAALGVLSRGVLSRNMLLRGMPSPGLPAAPETRCARAMLACGLLAAVFCFAPLAPLLTALPLANKVRELTWWSCLAVLLLVPLVPLGLQALQRHAEAGSTPWRSPWPWLGLAGLAFATVATVGSGVAWWPAALLALGLAFAALAWTLFARHGQRGAFAAACALLLFATVWTPFRHNIRFDYHDAVLFHPDRVQAHADAAALAARLDGLDRYRFLMADSVDNAHLLTHAWTLHGFRSIHGGIGPTEYAKYMLLSQANPMVAALYGVRWSIWPDADARAGDEALRPGLVLRTHDEALPRLFFLSGGLDVVADPVEHLRQAGDASPLRAAVRSAHLPAGVDVTALAGPGRLGGAVDLRHNGRTRLEAGIEAEGPGLLILNEDPAARWRATLDGRPAPMFRVNGYQTALFIPGAGPHEVRIERPGRLFGGS